MDITISLDGRATVVIGVAFVVGLFALAVFVVHSIARSRREVRRERLLTAFHLPDDAEHGEPVRRYLLLLARGQSIAFWTIFALYVVAPIAIDRQSDAPANTDALHGPSYGAGAALAFGLVYTAYLTGGAIGAAIAMRVHHRQRARASLAVRDYASFVPTICARATFVIGPLAILAAFMFLLLGSPDAHERFMLSVAIGIALLAMAVMIPLANRLAQMPMPLDDERDPVLDEALRRASARMVAGDAVFMVAAAAAVTGALLMPTYQAALIAYFVVLAPAASIANALQPGSVVPRYLLRWIDDPQPTTP